MSESINTQSRGFRWRLLTSVSTVALLASAYGSCDAIAGDADRPVLWIEGGWQFEQASGLGAPFDPPFVPSFVAAGLPSPLGLEQKLGSSSGANGGISFQPENSDWVISASFRYGRSSGHASNHKELPGLVTKFNFFSGPTTRTAHPDYAETQANNAESHIIADFQVGKDVGLGMFGGTSTISAGVRFAQFRTHRDVTINGRPDVNFKDVNILGKYEFPFSQYHIYSAVMHRKNNFTGLGPSISWNASVPVLGKPMDGGISFDWGVNAALLFGRQKATVHSQSYSKNFYLGPKYTKTNGKPTYTHVVMASHNPPDRIRSRSVLVPNLGGFAGVSFQYASAKVSFGYRADFFFGAMDDGIDVAHKENRSFYGPFATIGIGIGG